MAEARPPFREGDLDFWFDAGWKVARHWDQEAVFRALRDQVPRSHGVDFVGVRRGAPNLYLIEVKDYRASEGRGTTRGKVEGDGDGLAEIVAQKVRDTVAGLIGATRAGREPEWQQCSAALVDTQATLWVVLWIEHAGLESTTAVKRKRASVGAGVLEESIHRRCRWLHARALVCSLSSECLPGLKVKSVAGANRTPGRR